MTGPVWLDRARTYVGLKEMPGPKSSPVIVRWWEAITGRLAACGSYRPAPGWDLDFFRDD